MNSPKTKIRVGVLRGGPSDEYEVSLKTGSNILKAMPEHYHARDIFIDKKGDWHLDGIVKKPNAIIRHFDVIFNALHGNYGEDGKVQKLLDDHGVPYTGSGALASAIGMNKYLSKNVYRENGLKTPHYELIRRTDNSQSMMFGVYANLRKPLVVKPATSGSSLGVTVNITDFEPFLKATEEAFKFSDSVLVEEFILGREATCAVIDSAKTKGHAYALAPIEIIKPQEICPGNFTEKETKEIQEMAIKAHKVLGLRHYSRSDFMVTDKEIYILETNTLPGLTAESLLPKYPPREVARNPTVHDNLLQLFSS